MKMKVTIIAKKQPPRRRVGDYAEKVLCLKQLHAVNVTLQDWIIKNIIQL